MIPAGVPGTVLTRRPDVSAAQRGMLAAQERVGVAKAAWFPADLVPHFVTGRIRPVIDRVFPFGELAAAKAHMEANRHVGKIALAMPTA